MPLQIREILQVVVKNIDNGKPFLTEAPGTIPLTSEMQVCMIEGHIEPGSPKEWYAISGPIPIGQDCINLDGMRMRYCGVAVERDDNLYFNPTNWKALMDETAPTYLHAPGILGVTTLMTADGRIFFQAGHPDDYQKYADNLLT